MIGGVVGWLASLVMRTDAQQGILLNIVVGIVGAFHRRPDLQPRRHQRSAAQRHAFLVSLVGAIILLAIVNLFRRGSVR